MQNQVLTHFFRFRMYLLLQVMNIFYICQKVSHQHFIFLLMIILLLAVLSQLNAMPVHSSSHSLLVAAEKVEKQWEKYFDDDDEHAFTTTTTTINAIDDNSTSQGLNDEELEQLQKDVKSYLENLRKPYVNYEDNTVDAYRPLSTTDSQSSGYSRKIFFKVLGVIIFLVSSFGCCKTKWRKDEEEEEEVDGSESAAAAQPSPPNQAPEQINNQQQQSRTFNLELSFLAYDDDDDDDDGDDDDGGCGGGSDQNNNNNNSQVESGDLNHSQSSPPPPPPADDVLLPTYDEILYLSSEKFSFKSTCCDAKRSLQ